MAAGTKYAKELNKDTYSVKTPAFYNSDLDEWLMGSANAVKTAGGVWVFQQGDTSGRAVIVGAAADDAAAAGNPVLLAGKYSATPATRHDGDTVTVQTSATGSLRTELTGSNVEGTLDAAAPVKANLAGGKYIATSPTYHDGDLVPLRTNVRAEQIVQPSNPIDRILVTTDQTIEPGLSYSLTLTNNTAGTYEECWLEFYSTNGTPGAAYASYVDSDTSNWQNILASYDLTTTLVGTTTKKTGRVIVTPTYIRMSIRNTHVSESMALYNACMALKKAS